MTDQTLEANTNLWPAVLLFSVLYLGLSALITTVLVIFDLNANSGVGIGVLVAATAAAARKFVVDHRRPFSRAEQLRFTLLAFAALLVTSVLQIVAAGFLLIGLEALPAAITETRAWIAETRGSSWGSLRSCSSSTSQSSTSRPEGSRGSSASGWPRAGGFEAGLRLPRARVLRDRHDG